MVYVCVICMVQRPPLSPMDAEYRRLLEAVVSPFINTKELEACHANWLVCANCKIFMQTLYDFQQKALVGLTNLKCLLHKLNAEGTIEDTKHSVVTVKIEPNVSTPESEGEFITLEAPPYVNPLTEELVLKLEPGLPASEHEPELQDCDFGSMMCGDSNTNDQRLQHPASAAPSIQQVQIPKMAATAGGEGKYQVFSHRPQPSTMPRLPNTRRRKVDVREGPKKRIRIRKKPSRVACPHCGKSVLDTSLRMHIIRKHGDPAPCTCDVCGKQCRNQVVLKIHKSDHDKKEQNRKSIDDRLPRPELFCQQCAVQFHSRSVYKIHLTSLKHLPRDQCQFECETCKKRFVDEKRRQHHVNVVHLGLRHKCDQCDKTFATPSKVRRHVAIAHEKRVDLRVPTHICHLCGKTFRVRKCMDEHLLSHEGLRPHQCPLCPATFTYKSALFTHNQLKHLKIKRKWRKKKKVEEKEEIMEEETADSND